MDFRIVGAVDSALKASKKMDAFSPRISKNLEYAVGAGALYAKQQILAITPAKLRGVSYKKGGSKLGVNYRIYNRAGMPYAIESATGQFHLWERDTKQHAIPKRGRKGVPRRMLLGQLGSNDWISVSKDKPILAGGSQGHHTFAKGAEAAKPMIGKIMRDAQARALRESFTGAL